jgi:hypothetical protein
MEIAHSQLFYWRESAIRKIYILEERKVFLYNGQEEMQLSRSSAKSLTPLDILNEYMNQKTTFGHQYPETDKAVSIILFSS